MKGHAKSLPNIYRTWIEVDRAAIKKNVSQFRKLIARNTKLMSVVKSNAYGHGLVDFAKEAVDSGVDWLGVDSAVEGLSLRKEGITIPILILGYTIAGRIESVISSGLSITVSHVQAIRDVAVMAKRMGVKARVHIKVDTGMHRQGFLLVDMKRAIAELKKQNSYLEVEGIYTHFAVAKDPTSRVYTEKQTKEFDKWVVTLRSAGFTPIVHASASGGTILFDHTHYDMVRVGIGLYGLYPSGKIREKLSKKITLIPVLTWKGIVSETKTLPKGASIGYDLTETLKRTSRVAVCPVGYWHGYPRSLSGKGVISVRGKKVRVLGRISMDMIVIDVTDVRGVKIGDEVILLGGKGKGHIDTDEVAKLAGTTSYELVTRLNPRMKHVYL
jgi:alanine racemase